MEFLYLELYIAALVTIIMQARIEIREQNRHHFNFQSGRLWKHFIISSNISTHFTKLLYKNL